MPLPNAETNDVSHALPTNSTRRVSPSEARPHYAFLDGLRGLAALYVVLFHFVVDREVISPQFMTATRWLHFGHFAVAVFIVLSGFCLMLPIAKTPSRYMRGGITGFVRRRARRILPPYYAALVCGLLFNMLNVSLMRYFGEPASHISGALLGYRPGSLLSHVFLVHNFRQDWKVTIDGPMWSVAVEWQIYFVFVLVLLPVWRRAGMLAALALALAAGLAPHFLMAHSHNLDWCCPWYLGLFALGMAGAWICFSDDISLTQLKDRLPWSGFAAALFGVLLVICLPHTEADELESRFWALDMLAGTATACLLISCTRAATAPTHSRRFLLLRFLEARWTVALAQFSYSLYLTHVFVLDPVRLWQKHHVSQSIPGFLVSSILGVAASLLFAYGFYRLFEKPFTTQAHVKASSNADLMQAIVHRREAV